MERTVYSAKGSRPSKRAGTRAKGSETAAPSGEGKPGRSRRGGRGKPQTVKVEAKAKSGEAAKAAAPQKEQGEKKADVQPKKEGSVVHPVKEEGGKPKNRRRYYHGKPKNKQQ